MLNIHERLFIIVYRWLPEVFAQRFFMKAWGHATPKPTMVYSNSCEIRLLNHGRMTRKHLATDVRTTRRYIAKDGKARFAGNAQLKGTQYLGNTLVVCDTLQ